MEVFKLDERRKAIHTDSPLFKQKKGKKDKAQFKHRNLKHKANNY